MTEEQGQPTGAPSAESIGIAVASALVNKGYTPHSKPVPLASDTETWWDKVESAQLNWPTAAVLIALLAWILVILKGWPWG